MCVHTYVFIYTYIYIYTCIYIIKYIHIHTHVCMIVNKLKNEQISKYVYIYI